MGKLLKSGPVRTGHAPLRADVCARARLGNRGRGGGPARARGDGQTLVDRRGLLDLLVHGRRLRSLRPGHGPLRRAGPRHGERGRDRLRLVSAQGDAELEFLDGHLQAGDVWYRTSDLALVKGTWNVTADVPFFGRVVIL